MSIESVLLTDNNIILLSKEIDHLPTCTEYNAKYNTNIPNSEYTLFLEDKFAWLVEDRVPRNYWDLEENIIRYVKSVYETLKPGKKITKKDFPGGLLSNKFNNSPLQLLQYAYPKDTVIQKTPWKILKVPNWTEEHIIKCVKDVYDNLKPGEKITIKDFPRGLIQNFNNSPLAVLQYVYPKDKVINETPWKILKVPNRYWAKEENIIRCLIDVYSNLEHGEKIMLQKFPNGLIINWKNKGKTLNDLIELYTEFKEFYSCKQLKK